MKKILSILSIAILIISGNDVKAQCTCQGSNGNVYYQQPRQQYYEPQQVYYQQPVQYYYPQNGYSNQQYEEPVYYQQPLSYDRGQRFSNTLDNIERVVNVFGQIIGVYQQIRGSGNVQQQYYEPQQQYYSPPQRFY